MRNVKLRLIWIIPQLLLIALDIWLVSFTLAHWETLRGVRGFFLLFAAALAAVIAFGCVRIVRWVRQNRI